MDEDRLKSLIERADVPLPGRSASPLELAGRIRLLYRRRQLRKLTAVAIAFVASGVVLWLGLTNRRPSDLAKTAPEIRDESLVQTARDDGLRETIRRIELEESIVSQLLTAERRRQIDAIPASTRAGLDRRLLLDEQVGQAAMAVLLSAENRAMRPEGVQAAREDYVYLMRVFPNTIWAAQAGEKLAALNP
jgi:hypothetical protein